MAYNTNSDPYVDSATGVLKNKLGIKDAAELSEAEANLTAVAIAALGEHPITGDFDLLHLKHIHKGLFSDLYTWAGKLRTVEMAKGKTRFASVEFLNQSAQKLFSELHNEKLLSGLSDKAYADRLAHYYSEVNILHPFRDGNGRTQRAFFTLLAAKSNRHIAWDHMDPHENLAASIEAYNGNESRLAKLLATLLMPMS